MTKSSMVMLMMMMMNSLTPYGHKFPPIPMVILSSCGIVVQVSC